MENNSNFEEKISSIQIKVASKYVLVQIPCRTASFLACQDGQRPVKGAVHLTELIERGGYL
ncbi:MAG TPA: hypothetical protein VIG33_13120 [Pseudobdellovibrionaceae bacterium]|jgi:hypothetical protein